MTFRQKALAKELVENGGNMASAMRKAGYSDAMIKNPQKVTRSKGFKEILENIGLDDKSLAKALKEGLNASKTIMIKRRNGDIKFINVPDHNNRHRFLETALELKGYMGRNSKPLTEGGDIIFINNIPRPYSQTLINRQRDKYGI